MIKKILLGLLGIIVLLVIVSFFLPREVHVERSIVINAPQEIAFEQVNTLKNWENWSPWNELDPNMSIVYSGPESGTGAMYTWEGNDKVGKGNLKITNSEPFNRVETDLDFMEQGVAKGYYTFEPVEGNTKVTWGFDSDMGMNPIGRYMGLMMETFLGPDFEKGLSNMKIAAESVTLQIEESHIESMPSDSLTVPMQ